MRQSLKKCKLSQKNVANLRKIYKQLGTWKDTNKFYSDTLISMVLQTIVQASTVLIKFVQSKIFAQEQHAMYRLIQHIK